MCPCSNSADFLSAMSQHGICGNAHCRHAASQYYKSMFRYYSNAGQSEVRDSCYYLGDANEISPADEHLVCSASQSGRMCSSCHKSRSDINNKQPRWIGSRLLSHCSSAEIIAWACGVLLSTSPLCCSYDYLIPNPPGTETTAQTASA